MNRPISRRDFLKLSSLLSLSFLPLPRLNRNRLPVLQGAGQPNILIFIFDALTARDIPIYGYPRNTTPNLARFASRATVYHSHHAAGNYTTPGTASLMTGVYPWTHRALHIQGTTLDTFIDKNIFSLYPGNGYTFAYTHNLMAESFLQQFRSHIDQFMRTRRLALYDPEYSDRLFPSDYNDSLWAEQSILQAGGRQPSSLFGSILFRLLRLNKLKNLAREYAPQFPLGVPHLDDVYFTMEDAINWLTSALPAARTPYLGYFHVLPPHEPFCPRQDFVGMFQDGYQPVAKPPSPFSEGISDESCNTDRMNYDEFLAYADAEFGRLYDAMLENGLLDHTVVIVTADHGQIFERGIVGHLTPVLYEPLLHIPLFVSLPGQNQRKDVYSHTSNVDILPTLASLAGQAVPDWSEGGILPGFSQNLEDPARSIFAVEAKSSPKQGPLNKATFSVIKENYKYIMYRGYPNNPAPELYDLSNDPEELQNLAGSKATTAADLQKEIEDKLRQTHSI